MFIVRMVRIRNAAVYGVPDKASCVMNVLLTGRLLGTPTKDTWPQFTSMPFYRNTFPQWTLISTQRVMPNLSAEGVDFVEVSSKLGICFRVVGIKVSVLFAEYSHV